MTEAYPATSKADFWQREAATKAAALEVARAENARLRALLEGLNSQGGLGLDVHERICIALGKPVPWKD